MSGAALYATATVADDSRQWMWRIEMQKKKASPFSLEKNSLQTGCFKQHQLYEHGTLRLIKKRERCRKKFKAGKVPSFIGVL